MAAQGRREDPVHRAGLTLGERLQRELQRQAQRRAAQRRNLLHLEGGESTDRAMAPSLQHGQAAQLVGLQTTGAKGRLASASNVQLS